MILITIIYILLLSLPFFPGIELGILIMLLFGKTGIIITYVSTIFGLSISYCLGLNSNRWNLIQKLGLKKLKVINLSKSRFGSFFENKSAFLLPILLNLPGNSILGGGGGISFLYGLNKKLNLIKFMVIISFSVLPLPLMAYIGLINLEKLL